MLRSNLRPSIAYRGARTAGPIRTGNSGPVSLPAMQEDPGAAAHSLTNKTSATSLLPARHPSLPDPDMTDAGPARLLRTTERETRRGGAGETRRGGDKEKQLTREEVTRLREQPYAPSASPLRRCSRQPMAPRPQVPWTSARFPETIPASRLFAQVEVTTCRASRTNRRVYPTTTWS